MYNLNHTVMSGTPKIVKASELDAESISYAPVKVNAVGGKNVRFQLADSRGPTYVNLPVMLTWGVNEYVDDTSGKRSYDMSLQFPSSDYITEEQRAALEALEALESRIKADAITYRKEWFNKAKMNEDVVDALWTPMLRYPKDRETGEIDTSRAPALRVKLPFWDDAFSSTEVYDVEGNLLFPNAESDRTPMDLISKGSQVASILQSGGIWLANGKFGTTWKLFQVVVKPRATLRGTCQIKLTDADLTAVSASKGNAAADREPSHHVADSDEEEESDAEEAASPPASPVKEAPAPAPKKKVVRRKVVKQ